MNRSFFLIRQANGIERRRICYFTAGTASLASLTALSHCTAHFVAHFSLQALSHFVAHFSLQDSSHLPAAHFILQDCSHLTQQPSLASLSHLEKQLHPVATTATNKAANRLTIKCFIIQLLLLVTELYNSPGIGNVKPFSTGSVNFSQKTPKHAPAYCKFSH